MLQWRKQEILPYPSDDPLPHAFPGKMGEKDTSFWYYSLKSNTSVQPQGKISQMQTERHFTKYLISTQNYHGDEK